MKRRKTNALDVSTVVDGSSKTVSFKMISDPELQGALQQSLTIRSGKCCVMCCPNSFNYKNPHPKDEPPSDFEMKEDYNIMFPVPKDPERFAKWKKNIPQYKGWELDVKYSNKFICSAHFRQDDMFKKPYTYVADNGDNIELKTKHFTYLKHDAVPVFFDGPGVPKYMSNKNKFKRRAPKERLAPELSAALKKSMKEATIKVETVEYDDDEYRPTGVVTPTSSPIVFESYSPVHKYTDDDIEFTDQVSETYLPLSSNYTQPQSADDINSTTDVTESRELQHDDQEAHEIILPIIVSTTSLADQDAPSSYQTPLQPPHITCLPSSTSDSSQRFGPIVKVVNASLPRFVTKPTPVKAKFSDSSRISPANTNPTEDKNLPSQTLTDAQNLLDILTEYTTEITDDTAAILTYEIFILKSKDIPLPSSQWALQKHPSNKFVSFSYVDVHPSGSLSEKRVLFNGNLSPKVWLDGVFKDNFNFTEITSMYSCCKILKDLHKMIPCPGTNHPAEPYSIQCSIYIQHNVARCVTCASKRKLLKKKGLCSITTAQKKYACRKASHH